MAVALTVVAVLCAMVVLGAVLVRCGGRLAPAGWPASAVTSSFMPHWGSGPARNW